MPHESTVDPEEPMHFKSWGDETSPYDLYERRRSTYGQVYTSTPRMNPSLSIHPHPDLPLHVTHDHDDDGDPDDEPLTIDPDGEIDARSRITYTPPKRRVEQTLSKDKNEQEN
jgi:hypothetical protein